RWTSASPYNTYVALQSCSLQRSMTAHILASHEVTNVITALQHDNAVTYNITSSTVNEEDDTPKEYYRRAIVVLFREDILQHLNTRFIQGQQELVKDFSVVPSAMRHKG
ncbi:hypothetical protein LSAT2_003362, partial [Lamellibrachia satsuma]